MVAIQITKENFRTLTLELGGVEVRLCLSGGATRRQNAEPNQQKYLKARSYGRFDNITNESSRPNSRARTKSSGKNLGSEDPDEHYLKRAHLQRPRRLHNIRKPRHPQR